MRAGLGEVQDPRNFRVDNGRVRWRRAAHAAATRRKLFAHNPRRIVKREEIRVPARHRADGQKPHVIGRVEPEARIANNQRIAAIRILTGEEAVLRRTGVSVGDLILDQFCGIGIRYLHPVAGNQHRHRVGVPGAGVLATLERPVHAVGVRLHPIDVDAPRIRDRLAQGEYIIVLRAVGVVALVLVVVGPVFVFGRGGVVGDRLRPKALRIVPCAMGFDRLADVPGHVSDVRLSNLDHLDMLQLIERAGVVVRKDELAANLSISRKRVGRRIEVNAAHNHVRLFGQVSSGGRCTLPVLRRDDRFGAEEFHKLAGEVDDRRVPRRFRPEHLERPAARRTRSHINAWRHRSVRRDPFERERTANLRIDDLVDVVEDELSLFRLVGAVFGVGGVPVDLEAFGWLDRIAQPHLGLDALHAEARLGGDERVAVKSWRAGLRNGRGAVLSRHHRAEHRRHRSDAVRLEPSVLRRIGRVANDRRAGHGERVARRRRTPRNACHQRPRA